MAGATDTEPGDTQCLLHIPYKGVTAELVKVLERELPDLSPNTRRELNKIADHDRENLLAIERWVRHFYFECICDCEGGV